MTSPTDAARVAKGLTPAQKKALQRLGDAPESVYQLSGIGGFTVLEALCRRGLAQECGDQLGRMAMPHVAYKYKRTPLGHAVAALLREDSHHG